MAIFTLIASSLAAAGFTGAVTIFGLSPGLSAALLQIGKAVLWSEVAKALAPSVPAQHVQAVISQSAGPRIRAYGEFLLGGTRALFEAKDGVLHQIIVMHHGEVAEVMGYLVDGEAVTLDGTGQVTVGASAGYLQINHILSGDGGDYADARAAFPTIWTTDHKLTGLATIYARMTGPSVSRLSKVFPKQSNTGIQAKVRASRVIDPRTMLPVYSALTGPAVMDYMTHADGYRIPLASVDVASFAAFTDLCDENVALRLGGVENRYRVGGFCSLEDAPKEAMARLLATADAQLYMTPEGKAGILGGQWVEPDVTISASDILSISLSDGFDEFTDFNVLKGKFISRTHRWQESECAELVDSDALLTQPQRVETHTVDMCPSHSQMQRLLKAYRAAQIRNLRGTIRTNLVGLKARWPSGRGKHVINIDTQVFGLLTFEVLSHSYDITNRTCDMTVATLENPYSWDAATEEGAAPPDLDDLPVPVVVDPVPTGLVVTQEVIALANDQNAVRIVAVVSDPGRDTLQLRGEYRRVGDVPWLRMIVGEGERQAMTGVLTDGYQYEVRASWVGYDGVTATSTITVTSNPTVPGAATGLSKVYSAPNITLTWTNGVAGYYRTRIYRGTSAVFGAATLIATRAGVADNIQSYANAPGAGTWYYWAVTINASNIEAAPTGPVSQTI